MSKVRVAIIDDGINTTSFIINNVKTNIRILNNGEIKELHNSDIIPESHGTICAAIFCKYIQRKDVDIVGIKILDNESEKGDVYQFIRAVKWCIENKTTNYSDFTLMKEIIGYAVDNGIIVVAAQSNDDLYTLPACLDGVIDVKKNIFYRDGDYKWRWYPFDNIEIAVCGSHSLLKKDNNVIYVTSNSNSYAVPVITAYIANTINGKCVMSIEEVNNYLEKNAKTVIGEFIPNFVPYPWNSLNTRFHKNNGFFDPQIYSYIIKKYLKDIKNDIEIPIINVDGYNYTLWKEFFYELIGRFQQKNIYYCLISDMVEDLELSAIYFPYNYNRMTFCKNIYKKYKSDVIILHQREKVKCDINIKISSEITLEYESNEEMLKSFDAYDVKSCIDYILLLLE